MSGSARTPRPTAPSAVTVKPKAAALPGATATGAPVPSAISATGIAARSSEPESGPSVGDSSRSTVSPAGR